MKMQRVVEPGGERVVVHYNYNRATGAVDDAKVVIRGATE